MTIPTRRTVSITGDFTSWGVGRPLKRTDDGFAVTLPVKPGTRLVYKFIVDGAWMLDPDLPFETGADGNRNHVIVVPDSPGIRAAPTRGSLRSTESESVPPRQELPWWLWFTPRVFGPPQTRTDGPKMFLGFGAVERFSLTEVAPEPVRSVTGHDSRREGVSIKLMALDPLQDPFLVPFARRLARAELAAVSAAVHGASISLSDRTLQVPSPSLVSFLQSATRELRGMSPPWLPSSHGCRGFVSDSRVAQIRRFCGGGSASLRPGDDVAVLIKRKVVEDGLRSAGATTKKSKLCRFYRAGSCRDGDRCAFSHGEKGSPSSRTPSTVALAAGGPAFVFFIEAIVLLRPAALPLSFSPSVWGKLADLDSCAAPLSVLSADSAGTFFSYLKLLCHSLGIERDSAGDTSPGLTSTATDSADRSREGPSAPVQTIGRLSYDSGARSRVLAALFSHSPMWERVERIFTSGSSLIDAALDALGLLSAVMRDCPAEVVVEVMPRLHVLVSRAISSPARHDDRLSRALGGLLPALASRLGKASSINAGRGSRSGVSEDLVHPSHAVPWLDVPRVPSTGDILIASAMSSADCNLDRLCTQQLPSLKSGSYRGGRAEYLETLYRLLRADGLNKILAGVGALNRGIDVPDRDLRMYEDVRVVGYCAARGGLQVALAFKERSPVPGGDLVKAKRLMDGNLLCISANGSFSTSSLLWAVVSSRSANVLNQRAVLVEILYEGAASAGFAGLQLLLDAASSQTTGRMVESPVFFQSVSYALARLQSLGRDDCAAPMPFELELVHLGIDPAAVAAVASDELPSGWTMHKSATHGDRPYFYNASSKTTQWDRPVPDRSVSVPTSPVSPKPRYLEKWDGLSGVATNLLSADDIDISQRKALLTGLSQRVSCTVGPPGTGKTHTSARFVEILLSDALPPGVLPRAPILMLAVKNHALDQFLGRMLDRFPGRVARIGGVAASDALAAVNLVVLRDRHKALYKACKATDSPASASTFAPFKDAKLWREKGRAEYSFYRVQDALGGALHSCVTPSEWLSVAAFCTQASSEQLACLIASAPTRGRRRFPPVRGADVALLYRQELLLRLDSAKALAHRAADGFAGVGDSVFGSDSAAVRIAFGKSIVETLRKPFEYTLIGAPCSSERVSDSGSGEWQTAAPRTIRLPSLYDALIDALSVWTDGLDCASIRRMFEAPDVTADASLLRVRQGGPAVAGPLAKLAFPDVLDVSEAFDDDESDRLREQRLLFDESDDIDGAWDSQLHMKVRPQGQDAPFAAALARLRVVPLTLGTADASDPLARLAFVVQPWSPGLTHLDDPSSRDELVALAGHENLWDLEPRQRAIMLHVFGCNAREMYEDARATLTPLFTSANDAMIEADIACDVALLQDMAVIGMTINGAAKHSKLLDRLGVRVVVVEEAAEINEALFVAALPSTTEHVYMAGDHNQLRPKPDCFALEQREYRFDVSAFERIVTAGFRHGLLQTQNRMSSDLADVVRSLQVYDRYLDATSAESKTSPLYLPGAVFWWDHNSVEGVDSGSSEGASRGYHNDAEADRAVAAAAWQMLHGTHASRIAILTPYKGQVTVIRRRLEKLPPVVVDAALAGLPERQDADVVASAVARVAATAMPPRSSLPLSRAIAFAPPSSEIRLPRVCTVDEFQGDEADFIVLSLVRCNSSGKLGFVETVNRVTVALSRARRGLIIVASAKHLLQSSVCARVLAHLDARSLVSEDFPLFCPRHGHVTYARAGSDVPLGSAYPCKRPCGGRLECNDPCLLPCHTLDANHVVATRGCRVPKLHLFPECGHQGQVACCDLQQKRSRPLLCLAPCKVALPCSHLCPNVCSQPCIDAAACPLCLEVHEATRQREMLEAIENRAATVARAKALSDAASATSSSSLRTLSRDEPMFLQVETAALRSVQAAHSFALRVVQIEEVCSSALEQRFFSAVEHLFKPTTRSERLYHGTLYKNVDGILREGFQTRQSRTGPRASHEHHLLGPAIYVCPDSSKAAREEYTGGNGEGALLVCDVLLGSTLRVNRPDRSFGSDAHRKAKKYDSCFVARGDPILFDEFAVYNPACVLPRRVQIIGGKSYFPITTLTANGACCRFVVRFERVGITACLPDDKPISSLSINGSDVKFYSLLAETAKTRTDGVYSHFHVAHSLLRLLEKSSVYPSIELLEVTFCDNPRSTASFEKARRALESREINAEDGVVFHGSDPESLKSIQCNGFRIGGLEGQRVVHGTMHGFGVYTGAAASVAAPYSRKGDGGAEIDLLVVKILRGTRSPNPLSGADCSMDDDDVVKQSFHYYSPVAEPDFVVLSSPALALPIYRVRFRVGVA